MARLLKRLARRRLMPSIVPAAPLASALVSAAWAIFKVGVA
jgi:hypothetical protein